MEYIGTINYIPYFLIGQLGKKQAGDESFDSNSGTLIRLDHD